MKCRFVETIRVFDGKFCHLPYHECRVRATTRAVFGCSPEWDISGIIVPDEFCRGLVKCRVVYDTAVREISFAPYAFRHIGSLRLVQDDAVDYRFKSADRAVLDRLFASRDGCDDVLIVQQGMITDTSFSNVVLEDDTGLYTPDTFLLNGTCRQRLLDEGVVRERAIRADDLSRYRRLYLINAMISPGDRVSLPAEAIKF